MNRLRDVASPRSRSRVVQKRRDYDYEEYDASLDIRNVVNAAMDVNKNMNATKGKRRITSPSMSPMQHPNSPLPQYHLTGTLQETAVHASPLRMPADATDGTTTLATTTTTGSISHHSANSVGASKVSVNSSSLGGGAAVQYVDHPPLVSTSTPSRIRSQQNLKHQQQHHPNQQQKYHGHGHGLPTSSPYHPRSVCSNSIASQSRASHASSRKSTKKRGLPSESASASASASVSAKSKSASSKGLQLGKEQTLFELRLFGVDYGVAVRKIHSNGKAQLRYVKCIPLENKKKSATGKSTKHNMSASVPESSIHHHRGNPSYSSSKRKNHS